MKFFTENEAQDYYKSILDWGSLGGIVGLSSGTLVALLLNRYHHSFHSFTPAIKYSLPLYPGFLGVVGGANHASQLFRRHEHPETNYVSESQQIMKEIKHEESSLQRLKEWTYEHRYMLCGGTWATTITSVLLLTRRDHLMTGTQKLVQARVAAQASTILTLLLITAMELHDMRNRRGKFEEIVILKPDDSAY